MMLKRIFTTALVAAVLGGTAAVASAAPPKCPPGQTAVVTVVGVDAVKTCRVL